MSIYNDERFCLPQVKIMSQDRLRLKNFLAIFGRKYAEFIRDLCDANIKWNAHEISRSFAEHTYSVAYLVTKRYMENDYKFFKNKRAKDTLLEQLRAHTYPYPHKIVRLPSVVVSRWQADNLHNFLAKYARSYADFVREIAKRCFVCPIDAQCENAQFAEHIQKVFNLAFDEMVGAKKMMDAQYYKRQWPIEHRAQIKASDARRK